MTMATRKSIFEERLKSWLKAKGNKRARQEITAHVCFVAFVHPKSVPRSFRRAQMRSISEQHRPGRRIVYGPDVTAALKEIWKTAGEPCAENVHPLIPEYAAILQRDRMWHYDDSATTKLLTMSLGTMKKRLVKFRRVSFLSHGHRR